MAGKKNPDHYLDLPLGQLNPSYDKYGDPLDINEIPEGASNVDILKYVTGKITERKVPEQETYLAEVLYTKEVPQAFPGTLGAVSDYLGLFSQRRYAICRIPEKHSCLPKPDLNSNPDIKTMTEYDLMLLSMHANVGTYYTAPGTDLPGLSAGDIVMVVPKDGLILSVQESAPHGPGQRKGSRVSGVEAFDNEPYSVRAEDFVANVSPDASAFISKMKASDLGNFSNEFLLGLAANAQEESEFCANNAGDDRRTVSGNGVYAIVEPNCSGEVRYYCSFGYWQMNVCADKAGGQLFAAYYGIDLNDKETLYAAITDPDKQFEFMYTHMQTLFGNDVFASEVNGLTGEALAAYWGGQVADYWENCANCANPEENRTSYYRGTSGFIARENLAKSMYREGTHMVSADSSSEQPFGLLSDY